MYLPASSKLWCSAWPSKLTPGIPIVFVLQSCLYAPLLQPYIQACQPRTSCVSTSSYLSPSQYLPPWSFAPDTREHAIK
jgi:hypothetical protein